MFHMPKTLKEGLEMIMRNDLNYLISAGTKCFSQTRKGLCFMTDDRQMMSCVELLIRYRAGFLQGGLYRI